MVQERHTYLLTYLGGTDQHARVAHACGLAPTKKQPELKKKSKFYV